MIKKYIKRPNYLAKIEPFIGKEVIKVIIGQRRVGKSYLLFQVMDQIKLRDKDANIIYIDKELAEFDVIANYRDLLSYVEKKSSDQDKSYLFIDEVQEIQQFEKALRELNASGKCDVYCTGSNAHLLSGELATHLSGRYIEIPVFGLSYKEFLEFHKLKNDNEAFLQYIKYGGLPYLVNLELSDAVVYDYLRNVFNTIVLKDVVSRHQIRNVAFLERLVEYLADNVGSLVSAKKISDFLKSQKIKMSPNIILDYLSFLAEAFFIFKTPRQDIVGKKIFEINDKYYFEDLGLRHSIIGYKQVDISKVLENLVFLHLRNMGYKITIGQLKEKEIDFVCEKGGQKLYAQVAYIINNENKEREFGNLLAIHDNYPKLVISADEFIEQKGYEGIQHFNIKEFLLKEI